MNKFIATLLNRTISIDKKILGRWNIDYCDRKINNKIDWSNVDHCGPCGTEKIEIVQERRYLPKNANKGISQ
jgi:hypothetical protein